MPSSGPAKKTTAPQFTTKIVRRVEVASRRRQRTLRESLSHWVYKNGTWLLVVLGLSLLGSFFALAMDSSVLVLLRAITG